MKTARTVLLLLPVLASLLTTALPAQAQASMFADPRARRPGDILTVVLAERTAAQRESEWDNASQAGIGGSHAVSGNDDLAGHFGFDARFQKDASTRNQSLQRDLLSGTMTARVVGIDEAGNLVIAGERKLSVNGESHLLKVSGVVRPYDVQYNNTVLSYQIADAAIAYQRGGFHRRFFRPGAFVKFGLAALLGGAVIYAVQ